MRHKLPLVLIIISALLALFGPFLLYKLEWGARCPFRTLTCLPCPTCGYTRWWWLVHDGKWYQALAFQPFHFLLVAFTLVSAFAAVACLISGREMRIPSGVFLGFCAMLVLSWGWNLYCGV